MMQVCQDIEHGLGTCIKRLCIMVGSTGVLVLPTGVFDWERNVSPGYPCLNNRSPHVVSGN